MNQDPSSSSASFLPLRPTDLSGGSGAAAIAGVLFGGVLLVALGAQVDVPMVPVPMSLQTYAVVLIGGLAGWRLGGAALLLYLACGALGVPVFADGASGLHHLTGMTAGYLFGFVLAAVLVGALAERGWTSTLGRSSLAMLIGHGVTLGLGAAVLAFKTDWTTAYEGGFRPFLLGGLAKSVLAAATILLIRWISDRSRARKSGGP